MELLLKEKIKGAINEIYNCEVSDELIQLQETRKDFKGDLTLVVFPLLRYSKNTPEQTGETIGAFLVKTFPAVSGYNVVKGFLNLVISTEWWMNYFREMEQMDDLLSPCLVPDPETILVEYSSPNTNKPLHLGHVRNNLLGYLFTKYFPHVATGL